MSLMYTLVALILLVSAVAAGIIPLRGTRWRPLETISCGAIFIACVQLARYVPGLNVRRWVDAFLVVYVLSLFVMFHVTFRAGPAYPRHPDVKGEEGWASRTL